MKTYFLASSSSLASSLRSPLRIDRWPPMLAALALLFSPLASGCGPAAESGPSQYVNLTYSMTPPGAATGSTPLKLAVVTDVLTCQRAERKIVVSAIVGAAGITITLLGDATRPQASLRADKDTVTVAEVGLKLPQMIDSRTQETANPISYISSDRASELSCTINIAGPDPFASFDGDLSCSTLTGSLRAIQANAQFHATPCP